MKNQNSKVIVKITLILLTLCAAFSAARAQASEQSMKDAIAALTAKIAVAPNDATLYAQRANQYFTLKKLDEALADANQALRLNPKNNVALIVRAGVKSRKNDFDGAIADYSEVIRLYPTRAFLAYFYRGEAYEVKGEYDKALEDYGKAREIDLSVDQAVMNARMRVYDKQIKAKKDTKSPAAESVIPEIWKDGDFAAPDSPFIVAKIVSHDGKKASGIIVLDKQFNEGNGYSSIKALRADPFQMVGYKVLVRKPGSSQIYVYQAFALDFEVNEEFRLPSKFFNQQNPDFKTDKLGFRQSVMLIRKNITVNDAKLEVLDILDLFSGLSLVRRQPFPIIDEKKAYADLIDGEINVGNYDEAKAVYQYLETRAAGTGETKETKLTRITNLTKLYRAGVDLKLFVEQEMTKYNFTEAEKQAVKTGKVPK